MPTPSNPLKFGDIKHVPNPRPLKTYYVEQAQIDETAKKAHDYVPFWIQNALSTYDSAGSINLDKFKAAASLLYYEILDKPFPPTILVKSTLAAHLLINLMDEETDLSRAVKLILSKSTDSDIGEMWDNKRFDAAFQGYFGEPKNSSAAKQRKQIATAVQVASHLTFHKPVKHVLDAMLFHWEIPFVNLADVGLDPSTFSTKEIVLQNHHNELYGQHEIHYSAWFEIIQTIIPFDEREKNVLNAWMETTKNASWWYPFDDLVVVCDRFKYVRFDNSNTRLHCTDGPTIEWVDGHKVYFYMNMKIENPDLVEKKHEITYQQIMQESNVELRRAMIALMGEGKYIEESGAKLIHEDKFGKLYHINMGEGNPPLASVRVVNSTPEPDGSYKIVYLGVPDTITTAHEAVAWTFNLTPEQYNPDAES